MIAHPPPPTSAQKALSIGRETALVLLAFAAGFGSYMGSLQGAIRWPQDYYAAVGAGALLALAKMIPSPGGGQNRG